MSLPITIATADLAIREIVVGFNEVGPIFLDAAIHLLALFSGLPQPPCGEGNSAENWSR